MKNAVCVLTLLLTLGSARADVFYVGPPADYAGEIKAGRLKGSIQDAIDAASDGDTIVVQEGTYFENVNFKGKNIVLTSTDPDDPRIVAATVIDGNQAGCVITFAGTEDETCVLAGFTISNGYDTWAGGICGGTWEVATHAIIRNNMITENTLWNGGAVVFCDGLIQNNTVCKTSILCTGAALCDCQGTIEGNAIVDNPCTGLVGCSGLVHNNYISGNSTALANCSGIIQNNTISDNLCEGLGLCNGIIQNNIVSNNREGIYRGDEAIIRNNVITGNWAGGLIYCHGEIRNNLIAGNSSALGGGLSMCGGTIENNTIAHNSASNGGGFYCCGGTIRNCIIWGNTATEGAQLYGSSQPSYSCIQDWMEGGEGNIDVDPCFADVNNGNYHLKSQAGRWDANEGRWTIDEVTSPCIDAGDPMTPIGPEPFPNGGIINMGAYGGTVEASKSYFDNPLCEIIVAGDINSDCAVNFLDFRLMALHWLTNNNL